MDEDEEREFSSGIVLGFLDQAESTFKSMATALYDAHSCLARVITDGLLQQSQKPYRTFASGPLPERLIRHARLY